MIEYIIFFILISIGALLSYININKPLLNISFFFISVLFFFFIGLRACGYDFCNYYSIFRDFKVGNEVIDIEPGFRILCYMSSSFRMLLLFCALLTVILHFVFIYRYSAIPLFSVFLISGTLLLPVFMGQMRQGIALGFIAFSFVFCNQRRYLLYFLFVILGMLFHFSAAAALIFLVVPRDLKKIYYYIVIIVIAVFFTQFLQELIFKLLSGYTDLIYIDKLLGYGDNADEKVGFNSAVFIRIVIFLISFHYRDRIKNDIFPQMLNVYFLSIVFYLMFGPIIPQLSTRGTQYFAYFDLLLLPFIVNCTGGYKKYLILTMFIVLTIFRVDKFLYEDYMKDSIYIPYRVFESIVK